MNYRSDYRHVEEEQYLISKYIFCRAKRLTEVDATGDGGGGGTLFVSITMRKKVNQCYS
jgi:hypothetical protein